MMDLYWLERTREQLRAVLEMRALARQWPQDAPFYHAVAALCWREARRNRRIAIKEARS